jgi:hypothetical protein
MHHRPSYALTRTQARSGAWIWLSLLIGLALLGSKPARAEQLSLIVNGKAIHFNVPANRHYNERNWGGGAQYDFNVTESNWVPFVAASGFKDSNNNLSYYAGGGSAKRFALGYGYHVDVGGIVFLMTRKDFRGGDPFLGALPVLSVGTERVAVNMTYIPKLDPKWVPVVFFQLKIGLAGLSG